MFKERLTTIKSRMQEVIEEAGKTDIARKAGKLSEELGKTTHTISEKAQEIGKTGAFQTISQATQAVKKEIDSQSIQGNTSLLIIPICFFHFVVYKLCIVCIWFSQCMLGCPFFFL